MSDQTAHVATPNEQALYDALVAGDHDTVEAMREDAYGADQVPNQDGPTPREQYDLDYFNAWTHYQADNEMPEAEREDNTAAYTEQHNDAAADAAALAAEGST